MATDTPSTNWGAVGVLSLGSGTGVVARGSLYVFRNHDTAELYLFALIDLGLGFSEGVKVNQYVRNLYKTILGNRNLSDPAAFATIPVNRPFSADDLSFSPGAEIAVGLVVLTAAASTTLISAWPFFTEPSQPGAEVNNDYFSGAEINSSTDIGLAVNAGWQLVGRWIKLFTIVDDGTGEVAVYDGVDDAVLEEGLQAYA